MQNTELSPYDAFCSNFHGWNPFEAVYTEYVNLVRSGMRDEQAVTKLNLSKPPRTGVGIYQHLPEPWKREQVISFKDILR